MPVSRDLMTAFSARDTFRLIASQVKIFLEDYYPEFVDDDVEQRPGHRLSLGFTFPHPVHQKSIDSGILLRWTKGFDIPGAVGKDVCALLQEQLDDLQVPVKVAALVNDTTGTLMSRAYSLPTNQTRTTIGAIFGTGTNATYVEKIENITKPIVGKFDPTSGEMLLSIEWGSFDNELRVLPNTSYDQDLDSSSLNPGNQMFEKRVSGMFLGELLRLVMIDMRKKHGNTFLARADDPGFPAKRKGALNEKWCFDSGILSIAATDKTKNMALLRTRLEDVLGLGAGTVTVSDAKAIQIIAHAIAKRAARLAGIALGSTILKSKGAAVDSSGDIVMDESSSQAHNGLQHAENVDIAWDGSVAQDYPGFEKYVRETLNVILGSRSIKAENIIIGPVKNGSSLGSAITALIASQLKNPSA